MYILFIHMHDHRSISRDWYITPPGNVLFTWWYGLPCIAIHESETCGVPFASCTDVVPLSDGLP